MHGPTSKKRALAKAIRQLGGGRTLKSIAATAGLNKSMVSLYANEKRYPRYSNLIRLAKGLGCSIEKLEDTVEVLAARYGEGDTAGRSRPRPLLFGSDDWLDHIGRGAREIDDEVIRSFLEGVVLSMRTSQATYGRKKDLPFED